MAALPHARTKFATRAATRLATPRPPPTVQSSAALLMAVRGGRNSAHLQKEGCVGGWIQDFKYAVRSIAGAKKFAAIVVATLALGIGANSAVFGVLNAAVLRPLPYDEPDRLVRVYAWDNGIDGYLPGPVVVALRDSSRTLDIAALYTYSAEGADLTDRGQPERVRTLSVSADYFRVVRVSPSLGQFFERADERRDAHVGRCRDCR
jgi:MacB-like periplasmic core domain